MTNSYLEENKGLIVKLANKYFMQTPKFDFDDLVSVGNNAALNALAAFDENRGTAKRTTYVYKAVENDIANFVRKNKFDLYVTPYAQKKEYNSSLLGTNDSKPKYGMSTSPSAFSLSGHGTEGSEGSSASTTIPSGAPPVCDVMIKREQSEILMEEVDHLPKREKDVIIARFFDNKKLKEIASTYGISKQRVEQIEKKAISRLRNKVVKRLDGDMID